jgi:fumarate reductase subunit C
MQDVFEKITVLLFPFSVFFQTPTVNNISVKNERLATNAFQELEYLTGFAVQGP